MPYLSTSILSRDETSHTSTHLLISSFVNILPGHFLDDAQREQFDADVQLVASVHHPSLLSLIGFIPSGNDQGDPPALVTDFMPRCSVHSAIGAERAGPSSALVG
jgi:hypothetical protein